MFNLDILSILVIIIDLFVVCFLSWRALDKKATLWGSARLIYGWVVLLTTYHMVVYLFTLFSPNPSSIIVQFLHPFVMLFTLNPALIAIIHYRGGKL